MLSNLKLTNLLSRFDYHMQELLRGSAIAFVFKLFAAGIGFGLNVVLARLLGAEGSGIFFLSFTIIMIAAVVGRIGMDNSLVRFIAANIVVGMPGKVMGVYYKAIKISTLVVIPLSITLYLATPWLSRVLFNKPELEQPLLIMCFAVTPVALFMLHAYALQGLKHIAASVSILSLVAPLLTIIMSILFVGEHGLQAASYAYLVASIITLVIGWLLWKRVTDSYGVHIVEFETQELLSSSMPLFIVSIATLVVGFAPMLILGVWESSSNIGIFSAASRTAGLISFILVAVNSIAAPKFSELYQKGEIETLRNIARNSTKVMMFMAFPALLLCLIFPENILGVFGDEFRKGALVLIVLSIGQFINVSTGAVGYLLMMTGHEKLMGKILIFTAFFSVLISFILIPVLGVLGAAIGSAVAMVLQNLISMVYVRCRLGITTLPFIDG